MEEKDYYRILGIPRTATEDEIKKAYRGLARKYHPDLHPGDKEMEKRFKVINEAYEVLKDPEKRAQYDRFGYVGAVPPGYRGPGVAPDFEDLFSEVFYDFFGVGRRRPGPEKGADLRFDVDVDFLEAVFGTEKKIEVEKTTSCSLCGGTGARPGTSPSTCSTCRGRGQVTMHQGFLTITRTCSSCRGAGTLIKDPCGTCAGAGKIRAPQTISVRIPAGVDTGQRLRLSGEGERGERGGPPGDLYVFINVRPHPLFKREGSDIIIEVPVSFPQAALGAEIDVPTIEGKTKLKIPPGTQSGKTFTLKGKGITSLRTGRRGDELIIIRVETPTNLTKRQKDIIREFAEMSGEETEPLKKNFFARVKELFE